MKFNEMKYERPNVEKVITEGNELLRQMQEADSFEKQWEFVEQILESRKELETMGTLASIRYTINTQDPFYDAENTFWDEAGPKFQELNNKFYQALTNSPWKEQFIEKLGAHFFKGMELSMKTFSPEIMEDLEEESKLATEYSKLMGGAQIPFRGETYTISGLGKFIEDKDRATRKEANEARWNYFKDNEEKYDAIYDGLVKVRDKMARKLGYENYVQMGYDRLGRTDYGAKEVEEFRKGVLKYIVPEATRGFEMQKERLGLDELYYYDTPFRFQTGNPKPQGDKDWMVERALKMYDEMSPETSEFFRLLVDNDLMDLEQKKGKAPGGYCTFIEAYKVPFIFSNFNGTSGDVDVLTHEFGHAFQTYNAKDILLQEQRFPGMESAEIHSMGMEYLAYPWMKLFFEGETEKYFFDHNMSNLQFIPYGSLVDAFQHWVYENPNVTPKDRKDAWRRLEKEYNPWVNYEDNEFLNAGGRWQMQGHIYEVPFYYIDYCLAQICAMQIFKRSREDREDMWNDYIKLCKVGGMKPFTGILEEGNLKNPFDETVVKETIDAVKSFMETIDTSTLE